MSNVQMTVTLSGPADEVMRWLGDSPLKDGSCGQSAINTKSEEPAPVLVAAPEEPFPAPTPTPVAAPARGRRKAAAGQNEPVTPPAAPKVPAQSVEPGLGAEVASGFPFDEPKTKKIQPSDMLDFHQIPDGATVTADFRFHTQDQFMKVVRDVVLHIPDRNAAQQVVTDCGFKSIKDVTQDKYSDVVAGLLRLMYEKAGKTVHVETPTDNPLV